MNSSAPVSGEEVAFVFSGTGNFEISSKASLTFTPPEHGPLAGINFTHDRLSTGGKSSKITGEGSINVTGIIYLPNQELKLAGNGTSTTDTPTYAAVIANTIVISGNGDLSITGDRSNYSHQVAAALSQSGARLIH